MLGCMVVGNHLFKSPVLKLRNGVGWFSLGRRVQPPAQCRIGLWPGCARSWAIKADTSGPGGRGPDERISGPRPGPMTTWAGA